MVAAFAGLALLVSCGPQSYLMHLETRQKSEAGLDLDQKTISIVYLEDGSVRDSLFNNCFSDGLAQGLESEFFSGERTVEIYNVIVGEGENYICRDSILNLALRLDTDVILLVDMPTFAAPTGEKALCSTSVYAYDTMDKADKIVVLKESGSVALSGQSESMTASDAQYLGLRTAKRLFNTWKSESLPVIYFDNFDDEWYEAILLAEQNKWEDARELWMQLAVKKNPMQASCAQYNVALACYLMREYDLALEWLDLSDRNQVVDLSAQLRTRILEKKGK